MLHSQIAGRTTSCALCVRDIPLVESHIIPAFVFRWKKETAATPYLRFGENPKRRVQDGVKLPLLCVQCEALFNGFETPFATELFYPLVSGQASVVPYGPWLLKFCVSVSWRVLTYLEQKTALRCWSERQQVAATRAMSRWRGFLLGQTDTPGEFCQHLVQFGTVEAATTSALPPNINRYFLRAVEMDVPSADVGAYTYAKLGPLCIFGTIEPSRAKWRGTRVRIVGGKIGPSRYTLPIQFDYFTDRADRTAKLLRAIPENQRAKIAATIKRGPDRFVQSDLFRAMQRDVSAFGMRALFDTN